MLPTSALKLAGRLRAQIPTSSDPPSDQSQVPGHCSLRSGGTRTYGERRSSPEEVVVEQEGPQGAREPGSAPNHRAPSGLLPPPPGPGRVCTWALILPLQCLPHPPPDCFLSTPLTLSRTKSILGACELTRGQGKTLPSW